MQQIISNQDRQINTILIRDLTTVTRLTTRYSNSEFKRLKASQHKDIDKFAHDNNLTFRQRAIMHEYANRSNSAGITRTSQESMSKFFMCSVDTIQREIKVLKEKGGIHVRYNGRQQTNTTTLLCVKYKLPDRHRKMRSNLTLSQREKEGPPEGRAPLPDKNTPDIFLTNEQKEEINQKLAKIMKETGIDLSRIMLNS